MPKFLPYLLSVIIFINLVAALLLITKGGGKRVKKIFALLNFSVALWSSSILGFYLLPNFLSLPRLWILLSHFSAAVIALVFVFFALSFPLNIIKSRVQTFLILLPFFAAVMFLFFSHEIVGDVINGAYDLGPLYLVFSFYISVYFLSGYLILFKQLSMAKEPEEKLQIKYVLFGAILASVLALATDLVFPYLGIFDLTWLGPVFTLILIAFIAIAIFRHHLFNIKVIATEFLIFLLWIFTLIRIFVSVSNKDRLIDITMFLTSVIIGILLIKSVLKEVKTREEKEKLAEQLGIANIRLRALDQAKSDFITIASHQLRSPITAIKGYASLLIEGSYGPLTEKTKDPLTKIYASAGHLVVLIDDFLNLSRIERGKMEFTFGKVDFKQMVKDLFDEFIIITEKTKKEVSLDLDIAAGEKFELNIDGLKIRQVVSNIIDNAVKYTKKGSVKVFLYKDNERGRAVLKIQDTGAGMTKDTQEKIFQKFVRASGMMVLHTEGVGLGLYVAKKIIDVHQGRIWAESEGMGKGSIFYIELPLNFTPPEKIEVKDDTMMVDSGEIDTARAAAHPNGAQSVQDFVTKL